MFFCKHALIYAGFGLLSIDTLQARHFVFFFFRLIFSGISIATFTVCFLTINVAIKCFYILLESNYSDQKTYLFAIGFEELAFKTLLKQS